MTYSLMKNLKNLLEYHFANEKEKEKQIFIAVKKSLSDRGNLR